jgi:hypothetical protein
MIKHIAPILAVVATGLMSPSIAVAQDAPPSYVADPGVYALILDNEKFRVTRAVWRPLGRTTLASDPFGGLPADRLRAQGNVRRGDEDYSYSRRTPGGGSDHVRPYRAEHHPPHLRGGIFRAQIMRLTRLGLGQ